jgi:hypothetical protein
MRHRTTWPPSYWVSKVVVGVAITALAIYQFTVWVGIAFALIDIAVIVRQYKQYRDTLIHPNDT